MKLLSTFFALLLANQVLATSTVTKRNPGTVYRRADGKRVKLCPVKAPSTDTGETTTTTTTIDNAVAAPVADETDGTAVQKTGSTAFSAPHYVIYADNSFAGNLFPTAAELGGFNRLLVAFYLSQGIGPFDNALVWKNLDSAARKTLLDDYHANGIAIMVSVFGSTNQPTTEGVDPVAFAKEVAEFVTTYEFDGVDCDWEDEPSLRAGTYTQWHIDFITALKTALPDKLISAAPMAAWFSAGHPSLGNYAKIHEEVGHMIDFYNLQFYNSDTYTDCTTLVHDSSSSQWPGSSLKELNALGIPWEKLVLGKPINLASANNGYMEAADLAKCVNEVVELGGYKNVMFWQWRLDVDAPAYLKTVLGE